MIPDDGDSHLSADDPGSADFHYEPRAVDGFGGQEDQDLFGLLDLPADLLGDLIASVDVTIVSEGVRPSPFDQFTDPGCDPFVGRGMTDKDLVGFG
jgi:hypothetical protein